MEHKTMKLTAKTKKNPAEIYLSTLKMSGRIAQRNALNQIASDLSNGTKDGSENPWWILKYEDVVEIISRMNEKKYAPATVNRYLCALKRVMQECWRLERISHNDYLRVKDISGVTNYPKPKG
jgi:site-specific recombinase XerD